MSVVVLLADGARADAFQVALDSGVAPALARIRDEGSLNSITTCFPSVTGPAYAPFLMGRFPGGIGLPGLRWFDRQRTACGFPDYSRSYVGYQMPRVDTDIDPGAPTVFECAPNAIGALNVIGRGLPSSRRIGGFSISAVTRAMWTHFRGNVAGWLDIDRVVSEQVTQRIRNERPDYVFAALTGIDKTSHAMGHESALTAEALGIVDRTAARIREDAERDGRWRDMHFWVTSDHGHSHISNHDDLADVVREAGHATRTHPWVYLPARVAVMVSGNAMAHIYLDIASRERVHAHGSAWRDFTDSLVQRSSVDIAIVPESGGARVSSAARGDAAIEFSADRFTYRRLDGDPLCIGADLSAVTEADAYAATAETDYPDSVVQIAHIAAAPRSGDLILSAAPGWDFRAHYEPIPHVSSHGSLRREHMLVPFLANRKYARAPRRTTDLMPGALAALGIPAPAGLDGESFV